MIARDALVALGNSDQYRGIVAGGHLDKIDLIGAKANKLPLARNSFMLRVCTCCYFKAI